jgi:hypothetical protein
MMPGSRLSAAPFLLPYSQRVPPMTIARILMLLGVVLLAAGVILSAAPGLFGWFGKLPGDIRIEGAHGRVFIPLTSMFIISIVASIQFHLFLRR